MPQMKGQAGITIRQPEVNNRRNLKEANDNEYEVLINPLFDPD